MEQRRNTATFASEKGQTIGEDNWPANVGQTISTSGPLPATRRLRRAETPPRNVRPRYRLTRRGKIVIGILPIALIGLIGFAASNTEPFTIDGLEEGALLGSEQSQALRIQATFDHQVDPEAVNATLDGDEIPITLSNDGVAAVITPGPLSEGDHELAVGLRRSFPPGTSVITRGFSVDTTAPTVELLEPAEPVSVSAPVTVRLRVDDPEASVMIGGSRLEALDGVLELELPLPPRAPLEVTATDPAGNTVVAQLAIPIDLPGEPGQEPIRGVHASGWTWTTAELRDPILQMIKEGKINTVQIDLKEEAGSIWYDTDVELAHEIGAVTELWDLKEVIDDLHALNVRVIGRIVNFRDPLLAEYAVESGNTDWIVLNPDGTAYGKYGGFTNLFNQEVREYNIQLAEEAARLGIDDVMYDYVRRPDDYIENLRFPGQEGTPGEAIIGFLEESKIRVHAAGARLGAAVFGIAATRPDEVAQYIPEMALHVDYIYPMVYPSHWGPGEYGVANPNSQPYDIVYESMIDFREQTEGTGASLVVWLQDFSLGVDYGPAEVRAQIEGAADAGVDAFLLWDAATTYTSAALD